MKANHECIVCGETVEEEFYVGEINDMDVVLCERHKDFCDKCEIKSCVIDGVCHKLKRDN